MDSTAARAPEWLPIDTAPKDGTRFLGLWRSGRNCQFVTAKKSKDGGPWTDEFELYNYSPNLTHWMPLPEVPQE